MGKIKQILFIASLCLSLNANSFVESNSFRAPASIRVESREAHARELLGKSYSNSIANVNSNGKELTNSLRKLIYKSLPKKYKSKTTEIHNVILSESAKYNFDPFFLMAVIQNESSFNPMAKGTSGEIGLMQILPTTAKWLAKKFKMKWNNKYDLENPVFNIKLGAIYLNKLRSKFNNHGQLYLAAYNMGPRNVRKALKRRVMPRDYAFAVMKRYFAFYKQL